MSGLRLAVILMVVAVGVFGGFVGVGAASDASAGTMAASEAGSEMYSFSDKVTTVDQLQYLNKDSGEISNQDGPPTSVHRLAGDSDASGAKNWNDNTGYQSGDNLIGNVNSDGYQIVQALETQSQIQTANLGVQSSSTITIFIQPVDGKTITLDVEPNDTVRTVKEMLEPETGFSPDLQKLIFNELQLDDDRTLSDYNIQKDRTLHLIYYAGGNGTESDPYQIETWHHLDGVRENLDANFTLVNSLNESTDGYSSVASETANGGEGFEPVGENGDGFSGTFDGDEHTISGLYIDRPTEADVGLFGVVVDYSQFTDQASIKRVGLEDVTVTGDDSVGGLVGYSAATVADSYVTGTVTGDDQVGGIVGQLVGGMVTRSSTTTTVDGSMSVGGLVGFQSGGDVTDSNTAGTVTGDDWVGGVVGYNRGGDVSTSYTNSTVDGNYGIGGLVGTNGAGGNVSESYATGTVSGADSVGGLIGENGAEYGGETGGNVSESYATGNVDGSSGVGGLVGRNSAGAENITHAYWDDQAATITESGNEVFDQSDGGHALRTVEMTGQYAEDNMFDFGSTWGVADNSEDGNEVSYPFLQNNTQEPAPGLQTRYAGGDGDAEPYELTNWGELDSVRANLNANFTLAQDLNESTAGYDSVASETANGGDGFEPIGDSVHGFEGSFNGNGNVISDLQINRSGEERVGLFGRTSGAATVENVHLKNATVRGESVVGGLVGRVTDGTIMHVSATVDVEGSGSRVGGLVGGNSGGEISKSHATGNVIGDSDVGGLVGTNSGEVSKSHATGEVEASDGVVGGLAGSNTNNGEISESYTTSDVESSGGRVGGLVGDNGGEILKSYATGDIASSGTSVGGLVGANRSNGHVEDSYWDIETTGQDISAGDAKGLTTAQMTGANASADSNMDGFDFENTWYLTVAYPSLSPPFEGEGTEAKPYELKNVLHLQEMRKDLSANYRLADNIDASETKDWNEAKGFEPIGTNSGFEGTINGNGYTISNLAINRGEMTFVGLFSVIDRDSTVENVGLVAVDIHGDNEVGGLVGFLGAGATVSESFVTGTVDGNNFVGGLVGYNFEGTVSKSYATGSVEGTENVGGLVGENFEATVSESYATGTVDGTNYVGGLVGHNDAGDVITSYATGEVNGTDNLGGLVGRNSGTVGDAYWDIESTNQSDSAGGTGLTTAQMTGLNATEPENMGALDFATNWTATDSYPLLQWSVADLALQLADDELTVGETTTATVTLTTVDGRAVGATTTSDYSSSDANVATVDAAGTVSAQRSGATVIEAVSASVDDQVSLSVRRVSTGGGGSGGGSGGGGSSTAPAEVETNDDGSVSVSTTALANQPSRFEFGDSVRDAESGMRFGRVDLTFGEDTEVSLRAGSTNRNELPDGTPALGRDGESGASGSDRGISYVEFTVSSNGVDASDRVQSSTIEFDTSRERLEDRGVTAENVALHRYNEDAGEWIELDTEIVDESNGVVTYESTTPSFSIFAVGERAHEMDTELTDDSTELIETNDDTPGFGLLVGFVSLLTLCVLVGRFQRTD